MWEFLLAAAPLPVTGAVGAPVNPLADQVGDPVPAVNSVLVVGAGLAGAATAIHLAAAGVAVDLVEIKPDAAALGSGITLQGNALRELRSLGVWDEVQAAGYSFDVTGIRAPDPFGTVVAEVPDAKTGGPDLPAAMGMPRPELARILRRPGHRGGREGPLRDDVHRAGPGRRRRGRHLLRLLDRPLRPRRRRRRHPLLDPPRAGHRPGDPVGRHGHLAGLRAPAGERDPHRPLLRRPVLHRRLLPDRRGLAVRLHRRGRAGPLALSPEEQLATMRQLSQAYHGPWDEIRETLTDPSRVNYTWFETHVLRRAVEPRPGGR